MLPCVFLGLCAWGAAVSGGESIQQAVDRNPGRMVFVPAGDYVVDQPVRITTANAGLWGPGRIIQSNPKAAIVEVNGAAGAEVRDLTLTRAEGKQETFQPGLRVLRSPDAVVANVSVIDNWSDNSAIDVETSDRAEIRDSLVRNYARISVDDRTHPASNSGAVIGYAFRCINGTGLNVKSSIGASIRGNRIIELRLLPTPELKAKYHLGRFTRKNATKSPFVSQAAWDAEYVNIWRQGAALHVGSGMTSDYIRIIGNYIQNAQQGMDIQADHVIIADNIVNDAAHGMKTTHGARNVIVVGNQFSKIDLFGIGMMQGMASHVAGQRPNRGPAPIGANIDGHSIIAHNIISDFGFGLSHWLWPINDSIGPAPFQFGGNGLPDSPVLRDVIVEGNVVYNPGRDQILVDGKPQVQPARYNYAVRLQPGAKAPRGLHFSDNLLDPGVKGTFSAEPGAGGAPAGK